MKRINKYIFALSLLSIIGCSNDFLNTEPVTDLTDESFYQIPEHAYTALVGCYDGMQIVTGASGRTFYTASEVMSDDCFGGLGHSDPYDYQAVDEFDVRVAPAYQNLYNDTWIKYYQAIYRCNVLLQKIDQIDWTGQENTRNRYVGEARFIRAYLYFEMVRLWENIPLLTEPSTDNIPQADPDEVYTVIAQDLLYASENIPGETYSSTPGGRATRWAAKSLLARVYLYYTGYYGQSDLVGLVSRSGALAHLEDVIALSGHGLVSEFANLWPAASGNDYAGESNEEIVFSIKYTYTSDYNGNTDGNHWLVLFGMREFMYYPYGNGWGITVNPKLYDLYNANDSRQMASVIGIEEEEIPFDNLEGQREYTGYYNKKYTPMSDYDEDGNLVSVTQIVATGDFQIEQFQDYTVLRYADVLLMAAELGSANAQSYFDQVRQRAYGNNFTQLSVSQENIMAERHLEFALEGIRYWDLLRQGIDTAAGEIAESATVLNGGIEETKTISASNVQTTKGLSQIPSTQITLSGGVLQQNTGW
ncbi:RagB/SusD family nutrient uptake outer membrane protein [Abyssalbus ytuae]|uniref:RagB/SusD family nutrient uptake outer membrane protein n=1 Tax=Abyssalbus ytuae TaxID=2926907 RepID=A0A9E6ZQP8_9FLAO|nr:RagB/SusD family nutrient uptake outer membrane protein [Abyssalbus ytuae]UOB18740.1 RagB/SusD family nutrient uptake outer membrane protein [Abyssalbus ytuae]